MNIKTIFVFSILSIYILKILWNIYLHTIIDDLNADQVSNFYKSISIFNFTLSLVCLIIFHIYLKQIDSNKYTLYTTYILFVTTLILEAIKIYVFNKSNEIYNFKDILRGITACLSASLFFSLILLFYVLKTNKINAEVELDTFKDIDFDNFKDDFDIDDFDIDNELLDDKLEMELNSFNSAEKNLKTKLTELESKNKELQNLLEKSKEQSKHISFNL